MKIRVEKSKSQDVFSVKTSKDKNTGLSNQNKVFYFSFVLIDNDMFGRLILHVIAVKNISSPKGFFFCKCQWKKNKGDEEFSEEKNSVTPLCLYLWALWLYYFDP